MQAGDVLVAVLLGKLTGQNLDVAALIALGGQGIGLLAAVLLEVADGEALAELLDLVARVIDIELAGHVVARPVEDSGQTVAQSAAAGIAHVHGAGGVGRDELHIVLCALAVVGAAILLVGAGTQHDAGPEGGGKEEVDEAGAGHLDLGEDAAGPVSGRWAMRASAIIFGALRQVRAPAMAMLEAMSPFLTSAGISTMKAGSSASGRAPSAIAALAAAVSRARASSSAVCRGL